MGACPAGFQSATVSLRRCVPGTTNDKDVLRHVEDISALSRRRCVARRYRRCGARPFGANVTASQARRNIARMADQFILGTTTDEAVKGARELWEQGSVTTIDLLGEKTVAESEADIAYANRVSALLEALATSTFPNGLANPHLDSDDLGPLPRISISVKPTALAPKYKAPHSRSWLGKAKVGFGPFFVPPKADGA